MCSLISYQCIIILITKNILACWHGAKITILVIPYLWKTLFRSGRHEMFALNYIATNENSGCRSASQLNSLDLDLDI